MTTKVHRFFFENQIFTFEQFAAAMGEPLPSCHLKLNRHVKTGSAVRIKRGLYASIPSGADPIKYPIDPYIIISALAVDTVIAYHTALQFHGIAYSSEFQHVFQSGHKIAGFAFRGARFKSVKFPIALQGSSRNLYVDHVDHHGVKVRVTSKERTLVDTLDRIGLSGGLEEVWRSIHNFLEIDIEKVLHYTLLLNKAATTARVGLFLQMQQKSWKISEKHLDTLKTRLSNSTHYLDSDNRTGGTYLKEWRIVIPKELLDSKWEEPLNAEEI